MPESSCNGLAARPFWNASILAPRFLASAFCAGPAILLVVLSFNLLGDGLRDALDPRLKSHG